VNWSALEFVLLSKTYPYKDVFYLVYIVYMFVHKEEFLSFLLNLKSLAEAPSSGHIMRQPRFKPEKMFVPIVAEMAFVQIPT